ncbi:Hypothetical predicted protein [Pelobates cultripes]|uniref:Uncharacterized protein n=1 Tax=Pelobates cultripes TaxID=61616 RepID=A0AAD1SQ48_PELCU|nr:Hypothetical predicted protein [Pelobates cultripes]
MAPVQDDAEYGSEESVQEDSPDSAGRGIPHKRSSYMEAALVPKCASPVLCTENMPASKVDIKNMLTEMKSYFSNFIMLVRQGMGTLTARLQSLDDKGSITRVKQEDLSTDIDWLKQITLTREGKKLC